MLKAEEIQKIELGHRQLYLFDLEDRTLADQEQVMAHLTAWVQAHGEAEVIAFTRSAAGALALSGLKVLQHLFWLAQDLKIQFIGADKAISPNEARTLLIRSPQRPVQVMLNQSVEALVFHRVKRLLGQMEEKGGAEEPRDETELARRLARKIREWKRRLETCQFLARESAFPGEAEIDSGLAFIRSISGKLDPLSLIHAFFEHTEALARLEAEVKTLATFYNEHGDSWRRLVQFAQRATETLASAELEADTAAAHERFKQILSNPRPYDQVDEACRLLGILKPAHDRIVVQLTEACRQEGRFRAEALIQKMKSHLDKHAAGDDMRNRSLYGLRQRLKAIEVSPTMARIKRQVRAAEEAYELFRDEVACL
jgi:hypothetical protein